jgi:hypothetical protein
MNNEKTMEPNTDHTGRRPDEITNHDQDGYKPMRPRPGDSTGKRGETQLFLLRIWLEDSTQAGGKDGGDGPDQNRSFEWHGKLQHVVRGEAHSFTGWEMMLDCLETMLLRDLAVTEREEG